MEKTINIYGAGLAGCEAAWQAAQRGIHVRLFEMKPNKYTPAHHSQGFAELVCSNSLRSSQVTNAVGLLKEELLRLDSLIMEAAYATRVPAGSALAVDRDLFSEFITQRIKRHENIEVISSEVDSVEDGVVTVIATGPLTSDKMADYIRISLFNTGRPFRTDYCNLSYNQKRSECKKAWNNPVGNFRILYSIDCNSICNRKHSG